MGERPSKQEQSDALSWLASFVQFYPCAHCAEHFAGVCEDSPPRVSSRDAYTMWWCEAHNAVNAELKNEVRQCDPARLIAAVRAGVQLDDLSISSAATAE